MSEQILYFFFFASILLPLHSFVIYPFHVWLKSRDKNIEKRRDENFTPEISIIISCYNEEKVIEETIKNFLSLDYPQSKIEFIIGSDASSDGTNQIVERLAQANPQIKFFPFAQRRGKSQVLNDLVSYAKNEILVFSDANTIYRKDALKKLVSHFADANIGGVCGKLLLHDFKEAIAAGSQEKTYWDAESWLKDKEGRLGYLIGANGGIYSIRKKYFVEVPTTFPVMDDFYISLKVLEAGKYLLYEKEAVAEEFVASDLKTEYRRKIRNNSISISTLKALPKLVSFKSGFTAYALWSHKIIRWFTPVFLLGIFIFSLLLKNEYALINYFMQLQILFYTIAIIGLIFSFMKKSIPVVSLASYFFITNVAMLVGIIKLITNTQTNFWQSTPRKI